MQLTTDLVFEEDEGLDDHADLRSGDGLIHPGKNSSPFFEQLDAMPFFPDARTRETSLGHLELAAMNAPHVESLPQTIPDAQLRVQRNGEWTRTKSTNLFGRKTSIVFAGRLHAHLLVPASAAL